MPSWAFQVMRGAVVTLLPVSGRNGISEASETVRRAGAETLPVRS